MITYMLTLGTGEVFTIEAKRPIKYWKSALMQRVPYGTPNSVYLGATWSRTKAGN